MHLLAGILLVVALAAAVARVASRAPASSLRAPLRRARLPATVRSARPARARAMRPLPSLGPLTPAEAARRRGALRAWTASELRRASHKR